MTAGDGWRPAPPGTLPLAEDEVHVWRARLRLPRQQLAGLEAILAEDERARAARFHFPEHRDAFVAGRGIQRLILARYAAVPPAALVYSFSRHGKPELPGSALRFNASNSGVLALYAVARGREVGVDVEEAKPMPDAEAIARRFFSAAENEVLAGLPEGVRSAAFFRCWTRKEAYLKAVGDGLSLPLESFDVSFAPGEEARLLRTRADPGGAARWTLVGLEPGEGYVGALALEGGGPPRVCCFDWGMEG